MSKKPNTDLLRRGTVAPLDAFDVPFEVAKLPSKGLLYSEDHPLCGETEVEFRPMTAVHENILASPALIKKGTVTSVLVKSCLVNQAVEPTTLLMGDKAAILLGIRISGFGADYRVNTSCPACGHNFLHTFDLSCVELKMLDTDPVQPGKNLFEFILPNSKKTITFSLLTDEDDLNLMRMQQQRKKAVNSDINMRITDEMVAMIKSVEGNTDAEKVANFVRNMRAMDSRAFRRYVNEIQPGLDLEQGVTCDNCGEFDHHKISLTTEFFWPSLSSD